MAQKLAPAEKNSTDISAGSATFCISDFVATVSFKTPNLVDSQTRHQHPCLIVMIIFTIVMHRDHLEEHAEVVFLISKMSERHREPGVTLARTTWSWSLS